jgi:hypothetical protein
VSLGGHWQHLDKVSGLGATAAGQLCTNVLSAVAALPDPRMLHPTRYTCATVYRCPVLLSQCRALSCGKSNVVKQHSLHQPVGQG